jgi:hypothetical protein
MKRLGEITMFGTVILVVATTLGLGTQTAAPDAGKPEDTELWQPEPKVVAPGADRGTAPSDAIILFDGKSLKQWVSAQDRSAPAKWIVANGVVTVDKSAGNIETKRTFKNYQLHMEWRIPENITGSGQLRGNSGLFLASTGPGDAGYELQVLDSYNNKTYVNGMAGSIYKQSIPLANSMRKPGAWQVYDVVWTAPIFNPDGSLKSPAFVTVFLRVEGRDAIHRPALLQEVRRCTHQASSPQRSEPAHQLQEYLGKGAGLGAGWWHEM